MKLIKRPFVFGLLPAVLAAAGCLSKPAMVSKSFTIDPPVARSSSSPDGVVVSLARVEVAPPYSGQSLVYRVGEHDLERDPYARFIAPPGWLLTVAIRGYLANADFVRDVVAPGDGARSDATVAVAVLTMVGDLGGNAPSAALTLRFRVLSGPAALGRAEILLKTYSKTIAIERPTARDVVDAWNRGLAEIMAAFQTDLEAALAAARAPSAQCGPQAGQASGPR